MQAAHDRIRSHIHRTPTLTNRTINAISGVSIYFKPENFQKIGAFKARGGMNAILQLSEQERYYGRTLGPVTTHSSGNHAQAVAFAARQVGTKAYIVMPRTAPQVKKEAVRDYGAEIIECEPTLEAREAGVLVGSRAGEAAQAGTRRKIGCAFGDAPRNGTCAGLQRME
ncbi:pyridoxal-phosphate dependent enzyme [bacterium]|nr:MAG: pyridoxal-phosphate dependent enzyme [bacterium]